MVYLNWLQTLVNITDSRNKHRNLIRFWLGSERSCNRKEGEGKMKANVKYVLKWNNFRYMFIINKVIFKIALQCSFVHEPYTLSSKTHIYLYFYLHFIFKDSHLRSPSFNFKKTFHFIHSRLVFEGNLNKFMFRAHFSINFRSSRTSKWHMTTVFSHPILRYYAVWLFRDSAIRLKTLYYFCIFNFFL